MKTRYFVAMLVTLVVASTLTSFAQFTPRKDVVWARDVLGAMMTLDGTLSESVWAKAESVMIAYGTIDGNSGSGWKIMNGSGTPRDSARAVLKFLADKSANKLYIAVIANDSSVGGGSWENSDGILGRISNRNEIVDINQIRFPRDVFITWLDSSGLGTLPNLKGGNLPSRGIITAAATVQGVSNSDTNAQGQRVADQGWTIEMAVNLDSLGYNANFSQTDAVEFSTSIWDADWRNSPDHIATKAWWLNEWGDNGGTMGRILMRNDVDVNTAVLPPYDPDLTIPNGANYTAITVDGDLKDSVWNHVPYFDIQYGNTALRNSYPTIGPYRSGQYVTKGTTPYNAGVARVRMFFKDDMLYIGADVADRSLNHYTQDDFFDGLQVNMNIPIPELRDQNAHVMAAQRFGVAVDSVSKGGSSLLWNAMDSIWQARGALSYGLMLKPGSTIDNNNDVDAGYTIEMAFDLTKMGYSAGQMNKIVALGVDYHDYDMSTTDTSAYRAWWFREWPWGATPAFCLLDNSMLVTAVGDKGDQAVANEFRLVGNYPNPFNPSTTIQFSTPSAGIAQIKVYDLLGQLVNSSEFPSLTGGNHEWTFSPSNLASGVYYYRVEFVSQRNGTKQISETKRMVLLK